MATQRLVNTNFWKDTYVIDLEPTEKLLFLYFLTNPYTTMTGVYEISMRQVAFDTAIDKSDVDKSLQKFLKDGKLEYENGWIILRNFVKHQRANPSIRRGIVKSLSELPSWLKDQLLETNFSGIQQWSEYADYPQSGNSLGTQSPQYNINKRNRIEDKEIESNITKPAAGRSQKSKDLDGMFEYWQAQVGYAITSRVKQNREFAGKLLGDYSKQEIAFMIQAAAAASEDQYAPGVSNFIDLYRKWDAIKLWGKKKGLNHAKTQGVDLTV